MISMVIILSHPWIYDFNFNTDVLDAFKTDAKPTYHTTLPPRDVTPSSDPKTGLILEEDPADLFGKEFDAQLQAGMEEWLKELGHPSKAGKESTSKAGSSSK